MSDTQYNGWRNYETWCANLWLTNDSGSCDFMDEQARECIERAIENDETDIRAAAANELAGILEAQNDEAAGQWMPDQSSMFADMMNASLREIDWHEIAEHCVSDVELYSAGWNMPGYMPDSEPAVFLDANDALDYIKDAATEEMNQYADDTGADYSVEIEAIAEWKADSKGEFGCNIGKFYYFVSKI